MIIILIIVVLLLLILRPMMGATDIHFHRKPDGKRIRVACVGDSITNGALIPGCFFRSYPAELQKLLGREYHVENFGLNGRTLQSFGDMPYREEEEYEKSLAFCPDIVVILLETNDTKPQNWRSQGTFDQEYRAFLDTYVNQEKAPKVILCAPPWERDAVNSIQRFTNDTLEEGMPPIVETVKKIGEEYSLPVIDFHEIFFERNDLLSYDGVHPNHKGAVLIAENVHDAIEKIER